MEFGLRLFFATENDSLNGASMLFGHLLTILPRFLRMCAPTGVRRQSNASRLRAGRPAAGGLIHLINSGAATLDATGRMEKNGCRP